MTSSRGYYFSLKKQITMTKEENYVWKDKEGVELDMREMDAKHLQYAHQHACVQEYKYHNLSGFFNLKREQLEEIGEERGISLKYPDEKFLSDKWGNFFCNIRKTKAIIPTVVRRSPLDSYKGLEQVDVL